MSGKKLTTEQHNYIVDLIAEMKSDSPKEIADMVKSEFDVDITRQNIFLTYLKNPSQKTKRQIEEKRAKFLKEVEKVPGMNKAVRARELWGIYKNNINGIDKPVTIGRGKNVQTVIVKVKDYQMAIKALEDLAKESGEIEKKIKLEGNIKTKSVVDLNIISDEVKNQYIIEQENED